MSIVVIGSGINERVAAHVLRNKGLKLTSIAEHHNSVHGVGWAPSLGLDIATRHADPWIAAPLEGGGTLELSRDMARSVEAIRRLSVRDAAKWPEFCERMARVARLLERIYTSPAPREVDPRFALRIRLAGRRAMQDFLRLLPMSVADLLDDWFESDALKGVLAAGAVMHLCQGPRSGGTAFGLLHHHVGNPPGVFRPPWYELPPAGEEREARLAHIGAKDGRVNAVVLEGGEEIAAQVVVSGLDPKRTLLELVDPAWLDPEFARAVRNIRARGAVARVTLALDRPLDSPPLVVAPSLDYLERAYDDAKYGRVSANPYLEVRFDKDRAQVHVQYVPYGTADAAGIGEMVVRLLAAHLQGASIVAREVLLPRDLERLEGWPQGQAYHAELALDQLLWMRPIGGWARYRTPIKGLYLCGPATHPGAGIAGASGYLCAREVLRRR